tara:strand:- start:321 stop:1541 length:1221 start_codon:yes stop_codon:yes gene_type:complete
MNSILEGLRIIEGSAFVAAPLGGMMLAQMGADVIRFDMIGGGLDYNRWPVNNENKSIYWAGMNKGKKSIAVNFRTDEGKEIIRNLITAPGSNAGIFLTNLPVRSWCSYDSLKNLREDVITLNITGNPDKTTAVDYTVNAKTGWPFTTGPENMAADEPINNVVPAWDLTCGLMASIALLAAERHRNRTGNGQNISLSLADVGYHLTASLGYVGDSVINNQQRPRIGNQMYGTFGRDFTTSDNRKIMLVIVTARQMKAFAEITNLVKKFSELEIKEKIDLNNESDRWLFRDELKSLVIPWFQKHTLKEAGAKLTEAGILWAPFRDFKQMVEEDPFVSTANPLFQEIEHPELGSFLTPGSPFDFSDFPRETVERAPVLGEHTDIILSEVLGLSEREIGSLHDKGVVAGK